MINRSFDIRHLSTPTIVLRRAWFSSIPLSDISHQRGYGKIAATSSSKVGGSSVSTNLTEISHSSPMRLVPSRRSHPSSKKNGLDYKAAIVHLSSYGGGYVPGDIIDLDIDVLGDGAVVYVLTQGGTRIYRPGDDFRQYNNYKHQNTGPISEKPANVPMAKLCQSTITCNVDPGATLMFLPDPTVPYYETAFQEERVFNCKFSEDAMGSIIAVDWYGSGRKHSTGMEEERWAFDYLSTRTEVFIKHQQAQDCDGPILIESMTLDNTKSVGRNSSTAAAVSMGKHHDSYATLLLHGPNSLEIARRVTLLSSHLAGLKTRVRRGDFDKTSHSVDEESDLLKLSDALGGKALLSVSSIKDHDSSVTQTHLVRILAESNEDVYRILHFCLRPCAQFLGAIEPYKDRIHSSGTVRSQSVNSAKTSRTSRATATVERQSSFDAELEAIANNLVFGECNISTVNDQNASGAWFHSCLFSDSALPIGSFAHSLGTEAASQLGLFSKLDGRDTHSFSEDDLADYIYAVSRSNARFSTPIILGGYSLATDSPDSTESTFRSWLEINSYTDKLLKSNGPGRRASMDQGLGFLRIAPSLLGRNLPIYAFQPSGSDVIHAAPVYGVLAGSLGISPLDACRVFSFGAARDSVSAAVRLNLIGPVAGLSLLNAVGRDAVQVGLEEGLMAMSDCTNPNDTVKDRCKHWLHSVSTCAPLMDVVQPCHDLLSVRLFRT